MAQVGKQQMVEIAKALSKNAKLLILDEPTSSLNETDSKALLDLFRRHIIHDLLVMVNRMVYGPVLYFEVHRSDLLLFPLRETVRH